MINIDESKADDLLKSFNIPVKPILLQELQKECAKEHPSIDKIAKVVAQDVGLSASVLKAINSPIYGLSRTITDINQSIVFLGLEGLSTLIHFFSLKRTFNVKACISLERFWENSVELAQMSSLLIKLLDLKNILPPEDVYASALFQDCGIPPMASKYANYKETLNKANESMDMQFTHVEEMFHQTNHAIVGYFVTNSWSLPKDLCHHVLMHHERNFLELDFFSEQAKKIYCLLKVASNALNKQKRSCEEKEWLVLGSQVCDFLCLSELDHKELEADLIDEFNTSL